MMELLKRVEEAFPDLIRLSKDELAKLIAYNKYQLEPISYSRLQQDPSYRNTIEEQQRKSHFLRAVIEYNSMLTPATMAEDAAKLPQAPHPGSPLARLASLRGPLWEDVSIRFKDGHNIKITVLGESGDFDYRAMGMVDSRTEKPDVQWELLQEMAKKDGQLAWGDRGAHKSKQKQKERLAMALRTAFGIASEPFVEEGSGWKTRFHLYEK
jgi:hypothetical protein